MSNRSSAGGGSGKPRGAQKSGKKGSGKTKARPASASQNRPWGWIAGFTVLVLLSAGGVTYAALGTGSDTASNARGTQIAGVRTYSDLSRQHTTAQVDYPQQPPVGGRHNPVWAPCNGIVYPKPIPNEKAVHSLEHGTVWITYRPGVPPEQRSALAERVRGQKFTMMSPYPDQQAPIVLTAWGLQLKVDSARDDRIDAFLDSYVQGPQTPEPGATCEPGQMR